MTAQNSVSSLHICVTSPLSNVTSLEDFVALYHGVYGVLNALIVHHAATVVRAIPAFLAVAKHILVKYYCGAWWVEWCGVVAKL